MTTETVEKEKTNLTLATEESEPKRQKKVFAPRADIFESKEQIVVLADMPGVNQNSLDITLERNVLTIHGVTQSRPAALDGYKLSYAEYGYGDFRRVFTLSSEIDRDGIEATVKDGVLKLVLPKSPRALPRKIPITAD
ncbi:MAG: Hsp20/alpha crystallin family protein [Cyanobacteria bacterium SZAS LIN-3]|nr:Hsp20/alpha crystallin family protein [Cyanobacteria bacterium SZAS LIN-3]